MERDTVLAAGFALLAVLALGAAAATIDDAVTTDDGGFGAGGGEDSGLGEGDEGSVGSSSPASATEIEPLVGCLPWLREPPALLALFGVFALLFGLTYRDTGSVFAGGVVAMALSIPLLLLWSLFAFCGQGGATDALSLGLGAGENGSFVPVGGGATGAGGATESVSTPTALFTLLLVAAVLASGVLLLTAGRDDEDPGVPAAEEDDDADDVPDLGAVARTAGEAADRIEGDADVDNEVYRAWAEMTEDLEVDSPATATPAEFAEAAVDAGMAREDVERLTDLFETVRYGGAEPTPERERAAVDALRRIEEAYR